MVLMENINAGYIALGVVGVFFFGLQVWWISMTIENGRPKSILMKEKTNEDVRKELERLFSKSS